MSSGSHGRSKDGFQPYQPPAARLQQQKRQQQEQEKLLLVEKQKQKKEKEKQHQQQRNHHHHLKAAAGSVKVKVEPEVVKLETDAVKVEQEAVKVKVKLEKEDWSGLDDYRTTTTIGVAGEGSGPESSLSNLDRFLEYTTPRVVAQCLPKTSIRVWRNQEDDVRSYFELQDLWESFKEWSAYGAGVPLLLNGSDSVVQYYVPYLSGMQLYVDPSKPSPKIRRPGEESDGDSSRDTSSDGSSDPETDRGPWNQQNLTEAALQGMEGLSMSKPINGSSSDEGESCSSPGVLVFQYMEQSLPYNREPLADKISNLASRFPHLKTYRSCDLSPASWISVAWYPIYRIPTGPTLQNLDSCFLTFHSLSTPIEGGRNEWQGLYDSFPKVVRNGFDSPPKMMLPIFGLASYKFKISIWDQSGVESPTANRLSQAAEEWIRLLNVAHPDYQFFVSHGYSWR